MSAGRRSLFSRISQFWRRPVSDDAAAARRAEADAERLTTFLDSIVENIPAMVFVKDAEHLRYQIFNRGAERLTGRKRTDVLGRNALEAGVPPEQAAFFEQKDREVLRSGVLVDVPEEPIQIKNGERRWLHTKKIPILDAAGRSKYLLGISEDITEAKLATEALKRAHEELELRVAERTRDLVTVNAQLREQIAERERAQIALQRAESQLRQAQKLEAIGRLAGGIAHDFNNLLSVIISSTVMLSADRLEERTAREVDEIRQAGERAADLTRQLLAFSRQQVRAPTVLDLNAAIARMDGMLRRMIGEDIELETTLGPRLDAVRADAGQIEQVIMNLIVNARDAMPNGGRLLIETANVDVDEPFARAHLGLSPGRHVMLAVMDSGPGIDPAIQDKIFEPFFTTKEHGKGTGLGLATVFGIVRQNGGGVFVENRPGQGATFRCYFPYTDAVPARPAIQPALPVAGAGGGGGGGGGETVLLVEDDAQVRRVVGRILRQEGYDVVEAGRPSEALRLDAGLPRPPSLIITDLVMPEMNGRQLADQLRSLHPSAEVLYMSGYTDHLLDHDGVLEDGLNFLPKPIIPSVLIEAVHAALQRGGGNRASAARR